MSDHTTSQWRVKVNGGNQVGVRPGESLEIGRKPLRPLPDDGVARLEVEDSAKSMSKRHALLTVTEDGDALLRDLNSTNGSYVVNSDGELMRLPAGRDFPLPTSPIRLQFGDVPIDFMRVDQPEPAVKPFTPHVPNLFDYSSPTTVRQEPEAADMSVDDILDLRAGEPTAVFNATSAAPVRSLAGTEPSPDSDDEPQSDFHVEVDFPSVDPVSAAAEAESEISETSDSLAVPGVSAPVAEAHTAPEERPVVQDAPQDFEPAPIHQPVQPVEQPVRNAGDDHHPDSMPLRVDDPNAKPAPRDLFADAMNGVPDDAGDASEPEDAEAAPAAGIAGAGADVRVSRTVAPTTTGVVSAFAVQDNTVPMENQPAQNQPQPVETVVDQALAARAAGPAFDPEPGSVFEKVSNGDFERPPQIIEVDGYTSEDARHTTDMTRQFEMARHRELLPFLAMNPALYDDLYAWLAAQGNHDIDEALAHNAGYQDYREAVGK
ncbi:FHA domain-containing protein [Bifidobacterium santillanense]|uniref:FHA domain-containing protein n=1 Tax=Bifidobacterium santillanense TaxID=2809028 RepID=UPI0030B81EBF